ncbi:hypothetical protein SAMN05421640_2555 [Ekhidna lutea]|uniref:Uncharacterized protein n=1 Tax=Ekhidna lutea TaxID=447679 RepID=A0A239KAW7_EKHLU|nr:hypothetical protein [Ekhidna lutea]SNT15586.1 hypothetical protein SAMN05421640_2555 [Ekhidna lutea]
MKKILIVLLILPLFVFSQRRKDRDTSAVILQPNRIEFEKERDGSEFYVVPGDENGILVAEETLDNARGNGFIWKLHMIDTALSVKWSQDLVIPTDGAIIGYEYFEDKFYLLFNKNRFRSEDLIVYQLSADSPEFITYEITTVFPIEITHFESVGETLLIAGYANFRPVVITYNINDRIPRVVPGFYDNKNEILDLVVDEQSKLFTVILQEKMRNKKYTVRVKTFTSKGDIIQDNLINPGDRKSLLDAASTTFAGGLQYLAGTHSRKSLQYSQGFYLSKFINGQQQFNKYYPFADLNNFFGHMKPKREQRIKNRIERKRAKGKIKKFNYRLLVHEILERDGEYIMIGEAYYPRYNYSSGNSSFSPYNAFTNSFGRTNPYFLGYKYTHAVVLAFDPNCNILWDQTFKIEDIQTYSLEENVVVSASGDRVILMYLEENEIRSKVVERNEIVEGRTFSPVKLAFETDEVKSRDPNVEGLKKWYDKTLFAYGEQSIKNDSGVGGKTHRKVFYINKIQYDLDRQPN